MRKDGFFPSGCLILPAGDSNYACEDVDCLGSFEFLMLAGAFPVNIVVGER